MPSTAHRLHAPNERHGLAAEPAQKRSGDLIGIQYARALAAMMVVVFHLEPQFLRMGFAPPMWSGLAAGVDIFFVISGLIMWLTTCDRAISPLAFLGRRMARIVPLYWMATSVMVVLMLLVPSAIQTGRFDLSHVVASFAFVAWQNPATGVYEPVVIPGWTLNYEMFFYIVFSVLLLAKRSRRLLLAAAFFGGLAWLGSVSGAARNGQLAFYTAPVMLEFVFGMALGEIHASTRLVQGMGRWGGAIAVLGGLAVLLIGPDMAPGWPRVLLSGVPALAVVAGVLALDALGAVRDNQLLLLIGNASYSLYLTHPFVISALSQVWRMLQFDKLPLGLWVFAALVVMLCCLVAALCYRLVEVPLIRRAMRPRYSGKDPPGTDSSCVVQRRPAELEQIGAGQRQFSDGLDQLRTSDRAQGDAARDGP
jgi:peptidoglycan/LPS O-acetylase OafA/YrhL